MSTLPLFFFDYSNPLTSIKEHSCLDRDSLFQTPIPLPREPSPEPTMLFQKKCAVLVFSLSPVAACVGDEEEAQPQGQRHLRTLEQQSGSNRARSTTLGSILSPLEFPLL